MRRITEPADLSAVITEIWPHRDPAAVALAVARPDGQVEQLTISRANTQIIWSALGFSYIATAPARFRSQEAIVARPMTENGRPASIRSLSPIRHDALSLGVQCQDGSVHRFLLSVESAAWFARAFAGVVQDAEFQLLKSWPAMPLAPDASSAACPGE